MVQISGFVSRVDELPPQKDPRTGEDRPALTVVSLEGLPLLCNNREMVNGCKPGAVVSAVVNVAWKRSESGPARPQFWLLGFS